MNVLLINPNRIKPPVMPLGLIYIQSFLNEHGVKTNLLDLCFDQHTEAAVQKTIAEFKPDMIGIGIRNVDNVVYTQNEYFLKDIKQLVGQIKAITGVPVVLGGAGYSIFPEEILKDVGAEYGIVGEGEKSMLLLCEFMQGKGRLADIPGLIYAGQEHLIRSNPICNLANEELDTLPFPDYSCIDTEKYYKDGGVCSIQTKRGCALGCIYCTYPIVEGRAFRLRKAEQVVKEMKDIVEKYGMNYFYFVDSIFNVPFRHAENICDEIIKSKLEIQWFGYVSPQGFTKSRLEKMVRSGADGIWLSTDTCSELMLKNMGKGYGTKAIIQAIEVCKAAGVRYNLVLVLGGPGETVETLNETFDFLEKYDPNIALVMYGLRIYPGTPLYEIAKQEAVLSNRPDLLIPEFYVSPAVNESIIDVIQSRLKGHENWFATPDIWDRKEKLKNVLLEKRMQEYYRNGVRGPFWAVVDKLIN
ncbi:B12-binding domain-containing radical SAM protein [Paenibacillus piscarius]|uniref:B12-binding domain-containing radical SAM protein n=1 Tax=Paenibacillus piscarius TaxID=1089681 RepID=UPI001EE78BF1|nr:radical SAM protein [Paenibacillus piscarius]